MSPIMERTLESITSPVPSKNNSFGSSKKSIVSSMTTGKTSNGERKLTGTGTYKIDSTIYSKQVQEEDDDQYDDDEFYSDDFEEDESDDDA